MCTRRNIVFGLLLIAVGGLAAYVFIRPSADALLHQAEAAQERGDRAETQRLITLLENRKRPDYAHFLRGKTGVLAGRDELQRAELSEADRLEYGRQARRTFTAALAEFEQVPKDSPLHLEAGALAGECFARLGNAQQAVKAFRYVLKRDPDHVAAHRWMADIHFEIGAMDQAIEHLEALARLQPDDGQPYWQIGHIHDAYGQIGKALENYRAAARRELSPKFRAEVTKALGGLLITQGEYPEAQALLDRCPPPYVDQPEFVAMRAECLWSRGEHDPAEKLLDQALGAKPDMAAALLLRAKMLLNRDQPRQAIPFLEKILQQDPHEEKSREQLIHAYRQLGDAAKAAEHQRRVDETGKFKKQLTDLSEESRNRPGDADVRFRLAEIQVQMGRPNHARPWLKAALICNPDHQAASKLLRQIDGK